MKKIPSLKQLKAKLRPIFNMFIRLRDIGKGCISCPARYTAVTQGWQAGHYYPSAVCRPSMDFDELNVNGQCAQCNLNDGNKQGYIQGLIKRHGAGVIDLLAVKKTQSLQSYWGIFEYQAMIVRYQTKVDQLKALRDNPF